MFSSKEPIKDENQVVWYRSNRNLLSNSCSFVFTIELSVKNHPVYKSISFELYRISAGAQLTILIGFNENSTTEAAKLNSLIKNDLKEYEYISELVTHGYNVIGRERVSLEIEVLNPYRNEFLLKFFELLNQTSPSQLPVENFKLAVNDMIFKVIPNIKNKNCNIEYNMPKGIIKPNNDSITCYFSNQI